MYIFLSLVVSLISLYYLGIMASTYNADTTYLSPLVVLLIYSVLSMIRELRKHQLSWPLDDDYYTNRVNYTNYNSSGCRHDNSYNKWPESFGATRKNTETVEYFTKEKKNGISYEKELIHYPTKSEVREKIKELENSRWFRIKRDIADIFAIDLTEKYRKKYSEPIKSTHKVKKLNKEDDSRYMPKLSWLEQKEIEEYNEITKRLGRSCEIAFGEVINNIDVEINNE